MVLDSEGHQRGEIHNLLPQTHSPGVDHSLFIMEMVEKSLEKVETSRQRSAGVFPLQSAAPDLSFGVSCFSSALIRESPGDPLYSRF